MRYLVILSLTEDDGTPDEPWQRTSPKKVILCKDSREVAAAIRSMQAHDWDWCVFEVVGDKTEQRAVIIKTGSPAIVDCEVV